jgi:hypothetical protein
MSNDVSTALRVYLGAVEYGGYLPYGATDRMRSAFPGSADDWLLRLEKYLALEHPPSDWSHSEIFQEQVAFEAKAAGIFPELDSAALNALACRWSYSWK